jgi:hypothetical protein
VRSQSGSTLNVRASTLSRSSLWIRSSTTMRAQRKLRNNLSLCHAMNNPWSFLCCLGIGWWIRLNFQWCYPLLPSLFMSHLKNLWW